jgi:aldehyde dehydrogenase (NAD+)
VAEEFLKYLKETLAEFYGEDPQKSPDYGRIVTTHHFDRLVGLLDSGTVFHGGQHDRNARLTNETRIRGCVSRSEPLMINEKKPEEAVAEFLGPG